MRVKGQYDANSILQLEEVLGLQIEPRLLFLGS